MSFLSFFQKILSKRPDEKEAKNEALKEIRHKYLNKSPSEISKMNVRDIAMALKQLNNYCIKKIQKANKATDINKKNINLLKQAKVAEQAYKYICELLAICASENKSRKYFDLLEIKKTARVYNAYVYNFQTAFNTVNKAAPGALKNSPNEAWQKLMKNIPDDISRH